MVEWDRHCCCVCICDCMTKEILQRAHSEQWALISHPCMIYQSVWPPQASTRHFCPINSCPEGKPRSFFTASSQMVSEFIYQVAFKCPGSQAVPPLPVDPCWLGSQSPPPGELRWAPASHLGPFVPLPPLPWLHFWWSTSRPLSPPQVYLNPYLHNIDPRYFSTLLPVVVSSDCCVLSHGRVQVTPDSEPHVQTLTKVPGWVAFGYECVHLSPSITEAEAPRDLKRQDSNTAMN